MLRCTKTSLLPMAVKNTMREAGPDSMGWQAKNPAAIQLLQVKYLLALAQVAELQYARRQAAIQAFLPVCLA
jgi:hypothetical protein